MLLGFGVVFVLTGEIQNNVNAGYGTCPNGQYNTAITTTTLNCYPPTLNAYTYVNNSQVSTTSSSLIQVGMKISYTPDTSTIYVSGIAGAQTNILTCGVGEQIDYGTGSAPGQGHAQTGTLIGNVVSIIPATTGIQISIPLDGAVSGLIAGTTYWFDIALRALPGGSCGTATFSTTTLVFLSV